MSSGKRNAQRLGEVGAGWGTPGSPECGVHGQIAQVSRPGRASEAGVVPARPRGLLGAELGSRGALGASGRAAWGRSSAPGREQLGAPGPGASLRSPNYF